MLPIKNPAMKTRYWYLLIFIVLALVVAVWVWKYTFRPAESTVSGQKADAEIAATQLLQSFETNEADANALYLDKILMVSGTVESVTEDSLGISVYLKDSDAMAGIMCSFDKDYRQASALQKGLPVTVKGICTGYLMDVVLNKCSLEPSVTY
jgi:hypothetical protein